MTPVVISEILAVGEFPTLEEIGILASAGFKSLINTQPDGEVARFASSFRIETEARQHGLAYAYAPLSSRTAEVHELERYAEVLGKLPAPIYAFCYSGARAAAASAVLQTAERPVSEIVSEFGACGFDLQSIRPWLETAHAHHARGQAPGGPMAADSNATAMATWEKPAQANSEPQTNGLYPRSATFTGFAL